MAKIPLLWVVAAVVLLVGPAQAGVVVWGEVGVLTLASRSDVPPALVGVDYYNTDCVGGPNLLKDAANPALEREQMFAMHASGLSSLRYTINYASDTSLINGGHGGAIAIEPDGMMGEPYRSRFIRYLTDAKAAGFADVTIAFYPYGPNSPAPWTTGTYVDDWDPSLYSADWRFVQDVRDLTKQYGPPQSHFDLMAEGPPSDGDRAQVGMRIDDFISRLYTDYVTKYGNADVFFTAIDKIPAGDDVRLVHLIEDLKSTGKPLPQWWGLDIEYTGSMAARNLSDADATLIAHGVTGSFALGETAYESADVASAVQGFNTSAVHRVVQVEEYPNWGEPNCRSAPYTGDAYLKVLGIVQGPLLGRIDAGGKPTLTTSDGVPVKALKEGRYTVVVTDASKRAGFRISGPGFRRQTTARFRGTVTWTIRVSGGYRWTYASVGRKVRSVAFVVLA